MNLKGILLTVAAIVMTAGASAQRVNRTDLCQVIPNLTADQQQKIDKLSTTHQNTMDALRTKFYAELDGVKASGYKTQMNTEMNNHYQNISGLLTTEQQTWFDQNCNVNNRRGNYYQAGYGRGQGYGQGLGRNQTFVRGQGYGRNQTFVRGQGYGRNQTFVRGQGRGRGRLAY